MAFQYKKEYERYRRYYQSLEPIFQNPSTQAYTSIIFSFLAVSLFGWYAIRPTMQTIFTLKREITDKTEISKKMEDKISLLIEAQAAYSDIQNDIPVLSQAIPPSPDIVQAISQLTYLARDTHVSLVNVSVSTTPIGQTLTNAEKKGSGKKTSDTTISVSVHGPYADVKVFLEGISVLRRIMTIDTMVITPQSARTATSSASTSVQVDLKLKLYYLSDI